MRSQRPLPRPDFSRRDFLKTGLAALSAAGLTRAGFAAPTPSSKSETLAATLFQSLTPEQRAASRALEMARPMRKGKKRV